MKTPRNLPGIRVFSIFLLIAGITTGQDNWIRVSTVQVRPGMVDKWWSIYKTEIIPAYKKAHAPSFVLLRNGPFGNPYEFTLLTPIMKFAEFDAAGPLGRTMTAEHRLRVEAELNECVTRVFDIALLSQPDISVVKEARSRSVLGCASNRHFGPERHESVPGVSQRRMRPIIQKSGVEVWMVYKHVFGSEGNQITILRSISSYGD